MKSRTGANPNPVPNPMESPMEAGIGPCGMSFDDAFYGTSTLGERGQLVIPAEARAHMDMQPGDKILIMRHPVHRGLVLFKLAAVRQFLDEFASGLDRVEQQGAPGEEAGESAEDTP